MEQLREQWLFLTFVVTLGAVALTAAIHHSWLRGNAFDQVPPRRAGLTVMDVLIAMVAFLGGGLLLEPVLNRMGMSLAEPANLTVLQIATMALVSQALTQLPAALVVTGASLSRVGNLRELGLPLRVEARHLTAGLIALVVAVPIVMGTTVIMQIVTALLGQEVPTVGHDMLQALVESEDALASAMMIASAVIVAPLLEEIVFRGLLQTVFLEAISWAARWPAILAAAALFAAVHGGVAAPQALPGLFTLGVVLGWLYERYNSLWPSIVLHMGFNALNILLATAA